MMDPSAIPGKSLLQEDFEDFFEESLCGFIIADSRGIIIRANLRLAAWTGLPAGNLAGKRFSDLLTIGGKIYYETHLSPLLRMQGFFDEIVLELVGINGQKMRVMVNAFERRDKDGAPCFIRYTILKASDRLQYEQNLQLAKSIAENEVQKQTEMVQLREQLIAVLGHDLRNPLSAITMAAGMLEDATGTDADLIATLKRSGYRMTELVNNIMDFARTRLGAGMILNWQQVILEPVVQQVVSELRLINPNREIIVSLNLAMPVNCDPHRIAQLLSNLVANAITHGTDNTPVHVRAASNYEFFELSVSNSGEPIREDLREHLFAPFTRETARPSRHGLGLGLYICAEIARAHKGLLHFTSGTEETSFIFRLGS